MVFGANAGKLPGFIWGFAANRKRVGFVGYTLLITSYPREYEKGPAVHRAGKIE
jgi:hypothetical protein